MDYETLANQMKCRRDKIEGERIRINKQKEEKTRERIKQWEHEEKTMLLRNEAQVVQEGWLESTGYLYKKYKYTHVTYYAVGPKRKWGFQSRNRVRVSRKFCEVMHVPGRDKPERLW